MQRCCCGRLSTRAGDADDACLPAPAEKKRELHLDVRAGVAGGLQVGRARWHGRIAHHDFGLLEVVKLVPTEHIAHASPAKRGQAGRQLRFRAKVRHHQVGAVRPHEGGHPQAAALHAQTHDHHASTAQSARILRPGWLGGVVHVDAACLSSVNRSDKRL